MTARTNRSTMPRSLSKAANYIIEQFSSFGIQIPAGSRIKRMYSAVCNDDGSPRGFIPENDPNFDIAREALRDFSQLEFFFDQIRNDSQKAEYVSILERIVSDSVLPQNDEQNSPGRDAQAEAFVFGVCKNADMAPVFEEPDVTCEVKGKRFGVAVKRIKNLSKLTRRMSEGAGQIHETCQPGFISVEVTLATNPKNRSIVTNMPENDMKRWWTEKMKKLANQYDEISDKIVRGIFLHEHCPVRFNTDYKLRSMTYGISTAKNEKEKEEWKKFKDTFFKGLPNLIM